MLVGYEQIAIFDKIMTFYLGNDISGAVVTMEYNRNLHAPYPTV